MRCTSPKTVGFYADGKTICWSKNRYSKEYATFQLPCGKCLSCRLENARQTAVRCVHEASLYEKNAFLTLTYNEENLKNEKLQYKDAQAFIKALRTSRFDDLLKRLFPTIELQKERRKLFNQLPKERRNQFYEQIQIGSLITGEYGDKKKRPHWHIIVFNWSPANPILKYTSDRGDNVYTSSELTDLWPHGNAEFGSVTFESAGYCARYATKKLSHGKDGEHDYNPISRRSSRNAIGKKWIEKNWPDVFTTGILVFKKGDEYITCGIPRYYEKWFKKTHPDHWRKYVTEVKSKIILEAIKKEEKITLEEKKINFARCARQGLAMMPVKTKNQHRAKILEKNVQKLKEYQKL